MGCSGVATGVAKGGQSATPDSKNLPKIRKKIGEKSGKKEAKSGKKGQNREVSFTLPLLTDRAGYATGGLFLLQYCPVPIVIARLRSL